MAVRYYDDAIVEKLKRWIPAASKLRVLKPSETTRLFELLAEDTDDKPFKLPLIALSRASDIELLSTAKSPKSFDGLRLYTDTPINTNKIFLLNALPIRLEYQLDIYTKKADEGEEYLRNFLFKLINNPAIKIEIPYNNTHIEHIANIRVHSTVSDTSDVSERIFSGQFTRWSIQFTLQDAFFFNIPYKDTWKIIPDTLELSESVEQKASLENTENLY